MTRAVIIKTLGIYPVISYLMEHFPVWEPEVDRVYISLSSPFDYSFEDEIRKTLHHKKIIIIPPSEETPKSAFLKAKEDLVLLLHDDTIIHKPGTLDKYFSVLEKEKKMIAPIHCVYNTPLFETIMENRFTGQFPKVIPETGERGYSFLHYLVFMRRDDIMETDLNFGVYEFPMGKYSELLRATPSCPITGDGFLIMIQMMNNGVTWDAIPRYVTNDLYYHPDPIKRLEECKQNRTWIFGKDAGWYHISALSTSFFDSIEREMSEQDLQFVNVPALYFQIAWMYEFLTNERILPAYRDMLNKKIDKMIRTISLDKDKIRAYQSYFHYLVKGQYE